MSKGFTRPGLGQRHGPGRWVCLWLSAALSACAQPQQVAAPQVPQQTLGEPVSLAINGFNYTDEYIDQVVVAGVGGGNLFVSSPTSGGGKTACCATWRSGTPLPRPIKVEWTRDRKRWCEKTVQLLGPVPEKPTALGVHFMPNGDIQVEITRGEADPKLKLDRFNAGQRKEAGNVIHDEETARCRDGR